MNIPHPNDPARYPRRVLLAVTGLSPQVVTETVYALSVEVQPAFVPTEIHLVTTIQGREHVRLSLLSADPGWFHRLRADYALPEIAFDAETICVLPGPDQAPLADIRTPEENEFAADAITRLVAQLTADDGAALHVSLAGGRKTMGYYLGYALSLFGRPQDRLSHVLVSAPFESHPKFFYPTPRECVIHTLDREQRPLDCRDAVVTLAQIPFVRLREGLPPRLLDKASADLDRPARKPLYLATRARLSVRAEGESLVVSRDHGACQRFPVARIDRVVCGSHADWSGEALTLCLARGITVTWLAPDGHALGHGTPQLLRRSRFHDALESYVESPDWHSGYGDWLRRERMTALIRSASRRLAEGNPVEPRHLGTDHCPDEEGIETSRIEEVLVRQGNRSLP